MRCRGVVTHAEVAEGWAEVQLHRCTLAQGPVLCRNGGDAAPGDGVEVEFLHASSGWLRVVLPLLGVLVGTLLGATLGWGAAVAAVLAGSGGFALVPLVAWLLTRRGYGEWRVRRVIVRPLVSTSRPAKRACR